MPPIGADVVAAMGVGAKRVGVIGAGMLGICAASWLQRDGHSVFLVESDRPGGGASFSGRPACGARPQCPQRAAEACEAVCNVTHTPRLRECGQSWLPWTLQVHRRRVQSHEHDLEFRVAAPAGLR